MKYYPVNINLQGRKAVVVGGGDVAARKISDLLKAGAKVTVISPDVSSQIALLARRKRVVLRERRYMKGDLKGAFVVVASTDDARVNRAIRLEANAERALLNIVDKPKLCDFIVPSRIQRGDFLITISTGGASPALSKATRKKLEKIFGDEYAVLTKLLRKLRVKGPFDKAQGRQGSRVKGELLTRFVDSDILKQIKKKDIKAVRKLIRKYFGRRVARGCAF